MMEEDHSLVKKMCKQLYTLKGQALSSSSGAAVQPKRKGKRCTHRQWSGPEKKFVMENFHNSIISGSMIGVGRKECEAALAKAGPLLSTRTWVQIKSCVKNIIDRNRREELKRCRRKDNK
ncbi:uncharacterized protein LOC132560772 [Ylistrum balloti]|uniref:uncharacterized protein LOC132560772 n=1 Tax=Ylistrum balloti TaxID=509963 RepID=UPI002905F391|nr:uncharacterized protein LOC132560772 [Ylistrum balloti]